MKWWIGVVPIISLIVVFRILSRLVSLMMTDEAPHLTRGDFSLLWFRQGPGLALVSQGGSECGVD